ncbi:ABC transporter ATP-binding protein [Candidatus Nesciobacter abundans]|uniref:ABC transporter ATP-binding protein n=1 Tax=Candidatus Nesciobacter abundans TaxID=2601668 RepID=A0A5C0UI69_9PROT|nr:ABC transporter ATP-binding protein [Candidatus Nesciobacter abundans]QEK39082.1 ABC transporter ATP-binding protein [Candidatus Nesciobacter abundans]
MTITKFVLDSIKPFRGAIFLMGAVVALISIAISGFHVVSKYLVDGFDVYSKTGNLDKVYISLLFLIANVIIYQIALRAREYLEIRFVPKLKKNVVDILSSKILFYPYVFFKDFDASKFVFSVFQVSESVSDLIIDYLSDFFKGFLNLVLAVVLMFSVHFTIGVIGLAWVISWIILSIFLAKRANKLAYNLADSRSTLSSKWNDTFKNVDSVFIYNGSNYESSKNMKFSHDTMIQEKKMNVFILNINIIQGTVFILVTIVSIFTLLNLFKQGQVTAGDFILITETIHSIGANLWDFAQDFSWFISDLGKISQGLDMTKTPLKQALLTSNVQIKSHDILFNDVSFRYSGSRDVFSNNGEIAIKQGEKIGLVGASGSGKSTFIKLMLGLMHPKFGSVKVGGVDTKEVCSDSLRKSFALIPQDNSLFEDTIMNNIKYGSFGSTEEDVINAAKRANIHNFISSLPDKYETIAKNNNFSGGQKQRIGIARGFLRDAKIFIFDESTSALDTVTEKDILASINDIESSKTKIIIAHRLYNVFDADRIFVFDKGRIVQIGSHEELKEQNGIYKTFFDIQTRQI